MTMTPLTLLGWAIVALTIVIEYRLQKRIYRLDKRMAQEDGTSWIVAFVVGIRYALAEAAILLPMVIVLLAGFTLAVMCFNPQVARGLLR